jgi:hypothetical protein
VRLYPRWQLARRAPDDAGARLGAIQAQLSWVAPCCSCVSHLCGGAFGYPSTLHVIVQSVQSFWRRLAGGKAQAQGMASILCCKG